MATKTLHSLAGFMLTLLLVACTPIVAPTSAPIPGVTIEVTADGLQLPAAIPAGLVTITYKNSTDAPTYPRVGWLTEGKTVAEFEEAVLAEDLPALVAMTITPGAVDLAPGEVKETIVRLPAGEILLVNIPGDGSAPQIQPVTTAPGAGEAAAPVGEFTADLNDFSFTLPDEIPAGAHRWEIRNSGQQWHEFSILKLSEGATIDDILAVLAAGEDAEGTLFEEVAFFGDVSPGITSWATIDLPAGEYTVVCLLPDVSDGELAPHAAHGQVQTLVVK
jgi:hypothetical protein